MSCNHKFKPRYSEKFPDFVAKLVMDMEENPRGSNVSIHPSMKEKIYVCDVCERCGETTTKGQI